MSDIEISVVIPTYNSDNTIKECLGSIKANKTSFKFEVIVVDAGSTDKTLEIAKYHADKIYLGIPNKINRNMGVDNAEGHIICFTDSDCIVPKDWLDKLVGGLLELNSKNNKIVGVGGGNVVWLNNPSFEEVAISKAIRSPFVSFNTRNIALYKKKKEIYHNPPMNSAIFKNVIQEVNGFTETRGYPEDLDLDTKIREKGYRLYYLPTPIVRHMHKSNTMQYATQMYNFGLKRIRINKVHPSIRRPHHYGPFILYIMLYTPLCLIPIIMALANAAYISCTERNLKFFSPIFTLTIMFYRQYGSGELFALRERKNESIFTQRTI